MLAEFTWGDAVRIRMDAPLEVYRGMSCSVYSIMETEEGMKYGVEFGDGRTVEVPASMLEKLT